MNDLKSPEQIGLTVIRRLHRMVRHGYRPWLGYDVASQQDQDIHLRRRDGNATLLLDGSVTFTAPVGLAVPRSGPTGAAETKALTIGGDDDENFDALFPPNTPNKRNLLRRLYEIGL
jgi:hypothetical protein